jgi:hypothetical protein
LRFWEWFSSAAVYYLLSKLMAPKVDPALHLLGGAGSGMVACTVLQPLDLLKTRLQQQRQDHLAFLREAKNKGLFVAPQKRLAKRPQYLSINAFV